jgi:hypothetical protein
VKLQASLCYAPTRRRDKQGNNKVKSDPSSLRYAVTKERKKKEKKETRDERQGNKKRVVMNNEK